MSDVEQINETALDLLENPGVKMEHPAIAALLIKEGASAGSAPDVIRFPRKMVQEKLALCPAEFPFADGFGNVKTLSPGGQPVIWSAPGTFIVENGVSRSFTSNDMAGWARLLDRLPNIDAVFGLSLSDIHPAVQDVVSLRIMAENTTKHIRVLCFSPAGMDVMVRMKDVVGNFPWFSIGFTAHGPLRWTNLALDFYYRSAGHGIPVMVNGEPMAGTSGPITLAGNAAVGAAEIIAGIVANQVLEPGRPCVFNLGIAHTFDMRTAIAVTGGPENALFAKMASELGRFYNIPSGSWLSTESMIPDAQAGLEKMFGYLTQLQNKVSLIIGGGLIESDSAVSPEMAVIDNEMIDYVRRYLRGIEVNSDTLAKDLIREVGISGSYLEEEHTLEHFREELFIPNVLYRRTRGPWKDAGSPQLKDTAAGKASALMAEPPRTALSAEQIRELDDIAKRHIASVK